MRLKISNSFIHTKLLRTLGPKPPLGIFCLDVILTISNLLAQTIETSSLPTDSSQPLFKQIEIFSGILTVYFNCKVRYSLGDNLQQHGEATRRSDKSLRVYWRIFVKIFVAATEICRRNKPHRFTC